MDVPRLIDNNARYFLYNTLQKCHENRVRIYSIALNIIVFILFVSITGGILFYNYKNKPTDYERQEKMMRDQQYIVSKIRTYQMEKNKQKTSDITNLPIIS